MTTNTRIYETPDAPGTYSDHYLLVDKSGAVSATKVRIDAFKDWLLAGYTSGYVGGNIATLTNGTAAAGQKTVTVDSTTGFVAGGYAAYALVGGTFEYNLIATVTDPTHLLLTTNIGTGGIGDNVFIGLISPEQYASANAIPHAGTLVMPETIEYANAGRFNVQAYGASPSASQSVNTAAINAAIAAAKAVGGVVEIPSGTYAYDGCLDLCNTSDVHLIGTGGHYKTILECHNTGKAAIEIIGSNRIKIENIKIVGHATDTPAVAIWTGRSTATEGRNTSQIWCERVFVTGHFTLAAWYNTGCESVQLFGCFIYMEKATCKAGVMHDWENTAGTGDTANALTPEHATLLTSYLGNSLVQALGLISHSFLTAVDTAVAYSPVYIVNETGAVQLRNTYVVAWGAPIYYMLGAGILEVFMDYVEGTPTYIVHGDYHAGDSNNFTLHLSGCGNAVCSSGSAIWFDDGTAVINSLIERSNYRDDLRFYNINASRIEHWSDYNGSINPALVVAHQSVNCYFEIENADTYTNADPFNTTVVFNSNLYAGYLHLHGLAINKNNIPGATGEAVIQRILRGSVSWSPPEIADDAQAATIVAITGVTAADPWFCMAHYSGITTGAYEISAYALDGIVEVVVTNRTGSPVTLTGTLSVVAWKITAA